MKAEPPRNRDSANPNLMKQTETHNSGWLRRLVRCHGHINILDTASWVLAVKAACRDFQQSVIYLLNTTNLAVPIGAFEIPNSSQWRTPYKRIPAWSCGETLAVSRLENNHPENGAGASGTPPNHAQGKKSGGDIGKTATTQKTLPTRVLQSTSIAVWSILFYLLMKDLWPTVSPMIRLPASMLLSLLQAALEFWLQYLPRVFSCDKEKRVAMTPNEKS